MSMHDELRLPPQALDAEESVLGSMLIGGADAAVKVMDILEPEDFYKELNGVLFKNMVSMVSEGKPIDIVTFVERLKSDGLVDNDNVFYVTGLMEAVPSAANINYYAEIVKNRARRRTIIDASWRATQQAYDNSAPLVEIEAELMDALINTADSQYVDAETAALESMKDIDDTVTHGVTKGIKTEFSGLDEIIGDIRPEEVVVVASRPGVGKTSFALNMAVRVAGKGHHVAIVSMEMSRKQLVNRMVFNHASIDSWYYRRGLLRKDQLPVITASMTWFSKLPISIDTRRGQTTEQIYARAKRLQLQGKLDLLIVDYLGLIRHSERGDLYQKVTATSAQMITYAGMLGVPVILLHQINRAPESRKDTRPTMGDLRDSGAIEQDAHHIWLLNRPIIDKNGKPHDKEYAELIVAKNRDGRTGLVEMEFIQEYTRFQTPSGFPV